MQLKIPDFFVVATGKVHSVEYFVKNCFSYVGLNYKKYLKIDKKLLRPSKTNALKGDTKKAKRDLNFEAKYTPTDSIKDIFDNMDLNNADFSDKNFYNIQTFKDVVRKWI